MTGAECYLKQQPYEPLNALISHVQSSQKKKSKWQFVLKLFVALIFHFGPAAVEYNVDGRQRYFLHFVNLFVEMGLSATRDSLTCSHSDNNRRRTSFHNWDVIFLYLSIDDSTMTTAIYSFRLNSMTGRARSNMHNDFRFHNKLKSKYTESEWWRCAHISLQLIVQALSWRRQSK